MTSTKRGNEEPVSLASMAAMASEWSFQYEGIDWTQFIQDLLLTFIQDRRVMFSRHYILTKWQ